MNIKARAHAGLNRPGTVFPILARSSHAKIRLRLGAGYGPAQFSTGGAIMRALNMTTPVGDILITEEDGYIVRVRWSAEQQSADTPLLREASAQLSAYFRAERTQFDLPLRPGGSAFQRDVCSAMSAIPFGETRTYGELAEELCVFAQAIGQACGRNPIPIIIPCHRVLGSNGLGGFSGGDGIETKMQLLRHEGAFPYLL